MFFSAHPSDVKAPFYHGGHGAVLEPSHEWLDVSQGALTRKKRLTPVTHPKLFVFNNVK